MNKPRKSGWPQQLRQIQLVTSESSEGVIMIDVNQQIRWANAAALEMHDVRSAAELGRTIDEYHANFRVRFRGAQTTSAPQALDRVVCGESFRDVIVEVTPMDGDMAHWVYRVRNMVIVDDDGSPTCVLQIFRPLEKQAPGTAQVAAPLDMSALTAPSVASPPGTHAPPALLASMAASNPLHLSLGGISSLCALAPTPLYVLDGQMQLLGASQPLSDWLGYTRQEMIGRKITAFMTADSAEHFEQHTWKTLKSQAVMPATASEFVTKSGTVIETLLSATVTLDADGAAEFVVAAPVDISERKRCEEAFATTFSLAPVPMLIRTLDDPRILDANDSFMAATGFEPAAVIGHGMDEFGIFETRTQRSQFETGLRSTDRVHNMAVKLKTGHNDSLDCLLSARKIHAFGKTAVLLVLQDVSDRRRNEEQLFDAIETVMRDTTWFSRSVIEKLAALRSPPRTGASHAEISDLTPREREVLGLISQGLADLDISTKLGLTRSTVRNHVATLYSKIGVHSRSSAIIWARERGINVAWAAMTPARHIRAPLPQHRVQPTTLPAKPRQVLVQRQDER